MKRNISQYSHVERSLLSISAAFKRLRSRITTFRDDYFNMQKGFTLIELLVVVLIIGILAAVAVPHYQVAVERTRIVRNLPLFRTIMDAKQRYYLANGTHSIDLDELDIKVPYSSKSCDVRCCSYKTPACTFDVYAESLVWKNMQGGIIIDYWGKSEKYGGEMTGQCYVCDVSSRIAEKICKSLGRDTGRTSGAGTAIYGLEF